MSGPEPLALDLPGQRQFTSTVRRSCTFHALPQTTLNSKLTAASSQCPWKGRPSTLWPRTQTLASVRLLLGTCPEKEPAAQENGNPPKETTLEKTAVPSKPSEPTKSITVTCL